MTILLLLASLAFGQEDKPRLDDINLSINELRAGRPVVTGLPQYMNGIKFSDGTVQVTSCTTVTGGVIQFVSSTTTAYRNGSGLPTIPHDNTPPLITEGYMVLTATMTPLNASSRLVIDALLNVSPNSASDSYCVAALFQDNGATSIATNHWNAQAGATAPAPFRYITTAVSTNARVYSINIGCNASAPDFNGDNAAAKYGGTLMSSLTITEY